MIYYIVCILLILADQLSKYYVSMNFELYESIPIISNIFHLTYVKNYGGAFGILQNFQLLFILVTSIVMIIIFIYFIKSKNDSTILKISLILIFSGGIGNLIDRIRLGFVVDFLDLRIWPVFNIADSVIVIGSILLSYYILFCYKDNNQKGV